MANAALFFGWNDPKTGRESQTMELFQTTMTYWTRQMEAGTIESFEPVIMSRHGGDMNGFILVRGELGKLNEIRQTDEFTDMILKGGLLLNNFGVIDCYIGDRLMDIMAKWGTMVAKG
jgi:hypothetical protein